MPGCGSQVVLCDLPVRFDTYKGCSHDCKYCFVQRKKDISTIEKGETAKSLIQFISGQRTKDTNWCVWNIPLHWGGLSDPFQPAERECKNSLECLKVFAETKYPFVVSTKGRLIAEEPYLSLLGKCNAVAQISMASPQYDRIEKGAPTFEERLEMIRRIAPKVKRIIVRAQPYMPEIFDSLMANLQRFKDAGVYGITIEGMKFVKKRKGLCKVGADFVFPVQVLENDFKRIRNRAHAVGLKFYCAENRLRQLGDSMTCCGIDGVEGFVPNSFNLCNLMNGKQVDTAGNMEAIGTADCFSAIYQNPGTHSYLKGQSFKSMMLLEYSKKREVYNQIFNTDY